MKLICQVEESEVLELVRRALKDKGFDVKPEALKVVYNEEGEYDDRTTIGFYVKVEL